MEKKYKIMMLAFSGVPFIMVLGNSMLIPEFPQIKNALDIDQFHVGLLITVFSISAGITIPFLGYLCDQIGRIKVIVPALLLYGLGGIISGTAALFIDKPYYIILIGRAVQGIGAAGTAPIVMALVGDIFQSQQRTEALGIIEAANGIGKVLSPILGAAIGLISWIALFFSYALLSIPVAAGVWFLGKEAHQPEKQGLGEYFNKIKDIFENKGVSLISTILAGMVVLFVLFGLLSFFSDLLEVRYNIKGFIKGLIIAIPILFMSITSYSSGYLLKKIQKHYKLIIIIGLSLLSISLIALCYIRPLVLYLVLFSLLGIGSGLVLPAVNSMVTSSCKYKQRGVITSFYGGARFFGVAIGPPVFTYFEGFSEMTMYFAGTIISLCILLLALFFIHEKGMVPEG
ncbi:MAG TPA: MFS transporter [Halanaerobiales bacterium]|nr:MFS transporter [Halanaerobiales bacterium]